MDFDEYRSFDAIGLAGLVATGEVSATELAKAAIDRVSAVNETINAVVGARFESALREASAGLPEGPLRGVPYLIKGLAFFQQGEPATLGSRLFADQVADHDSVYTARCKASVLNIIGHSNSPELGLSGNTEPVLHGACRNPWHTRYSAGGSSGGAASAVAPVSCQWRMPPMAVAPSVSPRRTADCSASSQPAVASLLGQTLVRAGVVSPSGMWCRDPFATAR